MADTSPGAKEITWDRQSGGQDARVLVGQPVSTGKEEEKPLYDVGSGKFLGWQTSDGKNYRAGSTNGLAPMIYNPAAQQKRDPGTGALDPGNPNPPLGSAPPLPGGGASSYLNVGGTSATTGVSGTPTTFGGTANSQSRGTSMAANTSGGNNPMISTDQGPQVTPEQAKQFFMASGGPSGVDDATAMAYFWKANPNYGKSGVSDQDAINYFIQQGGPSGVDPVTARQYYERAHPQELQAGIANAALTPEQRALGQMQKVDPASEALRTAVAGSYLPALQQAGAPKASDYQSYLDMYKQLDPTGFAQRQAMTGQVSDYVTQVTGQAPTSEADALAKYQQLDPQGYARVQALGGQYDSYLNQLQGAAGMAKGNLTPYQQAVTQASEQLSLGSQLDPVTARQVAQQTRMGQASRGNVYGTPQLVEEAMTTGQAGLALQQQRQAALQQALSGQQGGMGSYYSALGNLGTGTGQYRDYLQSGPTAANIANARYQQGVGNRGAALGLQQSYLASGTDLGSTAVNLYNQNQANLRAAQQGALGYLGSGQTPYQAGAGYLQGAEQTAANAAQGGPQYNPASLGQSYGAAQIPQYGLDIGAQSQNYFNSLNAAYGGMGGGAGKNRAVSAGVGAASGALSGAGSGAALGSATGPWGAIIGAGVGAAAGGAGGYFSAPDRM